jgi:hypothetical protein
MPVRFTCPACHQLLSVAARKIGCEVKCPKCNAALIVPGDNDTPTPPMIHLDGAEPSSTVNMNVSDLVFYDDIPLVVDAPPKINPVAPSSIVSSPTSPATFDHRLVTFPRYVLYAQGALIGVVALLAFVLGIVFGRASAPSPVVEGPPEPVLVEGNVTYQLRPGQDLADTGAVVVVVPKEKFPTSKLSINGLRPQDPAQLSGGNEAVKEIESIDGSYQRVSASGKFGIMAKPGKYHVLVISRNAVRAKNMLLVPDHMAILADYFESANELIGNHQYSLASHDLPSDGPLEIAFRAAGR